MRGVTYGPFGPAGSDLEYHDVRRVERDFADMVSANVNAVRTYTVPPGWFLDLAEQHDLSVMVGLAWEQHVTFLDDSALLSTIAERVQAGCVTP